MVSVTLSKNQPLETQVSSLSVLIERQTRSGAADASRSITAPVLVRVHLAVCLPDGLLQLPRRIMDGTADRRPHFSRTQRGTNTLDHTPYTIRVAVKGQHAEFIATETRNDIVWTNCLTQCAGRTFD